MKNIYTQNLKVVQRNMKYIVKPYNQLSEGYCLCTNCNNYCEKECAPKSMR